MAVPGRIPPPMQQIMSRTPPPMHQVMGPDACSRSSRHITHPYMGTSLIRNSHLPQDPHRALRIVLLQGPRGVLFLMSGGTLPPMQQVLAQSLIREQVLFF